MPSSRSGLRPLASHTTTDPAQIRAQLAEIRRKGFAVSFEETDEGVAGVSVPIRDARDRVIASLTISGPLTRVNTATINHYTGIVREGARRIAAELGHQPSRIGPARAGRSRSTPRDSHIPVAFRTSFQTNFVYVRRP